MPEDPPPLPAHGAQLFRGLRLDAYGLDVTEAAADPAFGGTHQAGAEALDEALLAGAPATAAMLRGAIETDAAALAGLVRRALHLPEWRDTQRVLIGGGLRSSRFGAVAVGRAATLLREAGLAVPVAPIRHAPEEAGLIGAARLLPDDLLAAADAVLAAALDGDVFRAGVVLPRLGVAPDLAAAGVWRQASWHHATKAAPPDRATAIGRLAGMLGDLAGEAAAAGLSLAPAVAVGLPGQLDREGHILRGAEELPGDWLAPGFHLPAALSRLLPLDGGGHPEVLLHNDAVVHGLSEAPFHRNVVHWGVLTLGRRPGNARFTNLALRG
ncbi:hypothetical protein [Falsiroseomonas sp.]|uniref:hypothetical protein n=1 Tax=Falsiroseomonas sp. TaxID=2870721 RepID=UPI0035695732